MEVYVDNVLIKSLKTFDHVACLNKTFQILRKYRVRPIHLKYTFNVASDKFLGYMINQRGMEANSKKIQALIEMRSPPKSKG